MTPGDFMLRLANGEKHTDLLNEYVLDELVKIAETQEPLKGDSNPS